MVVTALVLFVTFIVLVSAEYLARAKGLHAELTRKIVHVAVGTFVAFWPFFLGWGVIQLLSVAFFAVVCLSIKFNVFRSIHAVNRSAVGELLFAAIIGILAFITNDRWVFTAAMLHLSLADGLAAIVGVYWGKHRRYKVFGSTKSIAGTLTFAVTSFCILGVYVWAADGSISMPALLLLPLVTAAAENVAPYGTDNVAVPLLVAVVLMSGL